jgi:hypothetical protein
MAAISPPAGPARASAWANRSRGRHQRADGGPTNPMSDASASNAAWHAPAIYAHARSSAAICTRTRRLNGTAAAYGLGRVAVETDTMIAWIPFFLFLESHVYEDADCKVRH